MTSGPPLVAPAVAWFPSTPAAVPRVRASTVRTLAAWSIDAAAVEVAEVIVSELITNAVQTSQAEDERVAVRLSTANGMVGVEVWNRDDRTKPHLADPHADDESGRGLLMVDALSTRWSWYRAPSGGTVVWAQFPGHTLPAPPWWGRQPADADPEAATRG